MSIQTKQLASRPPNAFRLAVFLAVMVVSLSKAIAQPPPPPPPPAPNLWMRDNSSDYGIEPSHDPLYNSPDMWVQNDPISTTDADPTKNYDPRPYDNPDPDHDADVDPSWVKNHPVEAVQYTPTSYAKPVWVYVKVRNMGDAPSNGTEVLRVYWAKGGIGLDWPTAWVEHLIPANQSCSNTELFLGDEITKPRKNAFSLTPQEINRLTDAWKTLNTDSKYQYTESDGSKVSFWFKQDEIHQATHVHAGSAFLPWHRELVNRFENQLRLVHPEVKIPYWDWQSNPRVVPTQFPQGTAILATLGSHADDFMGMATGRAAGTGSLWQSLDNHGCCDPSCTTYTTTKSARGDNGMCDAFGDCPGAPKATGTGKFSDPPELVRRECKSGAPQMPNTDKEVVIYGNDDNSTLQFDDFSTNLAITPCNHNEAHNYLGNNNTQINAINAIHFAFCDPMAFLVHSELDRMYATWQRWYGAYPKYDHNSPDNQFLRRLVAFDATNNQDDIYGTEDLTGPELHNDCSNEAWSVANYLEPWAGGSNNPNPDADGSKPTVPWDKERKDGGKMTFKTSYDPSVVTPPIYDDARLVIPVLGPHQSCIMQVPWYPPDPKVSSCEAYPGHFCLLARIERVPSSPFGMRSPEISDMKTNVKKNNNIIWKNLEIMEGLPGWPANVPPNPPQPPCDNTPCTGRGEVIVHNVNVTGSANTKLVFGTPRDLEGNPLTTLNKIAVDLGDQLHGLWVAGGQQGVGVVDDPCGPNMVDVSPTGGWLGNIQLGPDEMHEIHLWAIPSATAPFVPFEFNLEQYTAGIAEGGGDELIGGEVFRNPCTGVWPEPWPDDNEGGPALKQTSSPTVVPHLTDLVCTVHPNPASKSALVCIEEMPEGEPVLVEILNSLGEPITTLYNGTTEAEMGFCFRVDCSEFANGTYYAHIVAGGMKKSLKLSVQH